MSDKDYSLLRQFDLEAAKRGEAILYTPFMLVVEFVGEAIAIGCIATKEKDGRIAITPRSHFRLAPLCWVEGMPVYKGDVLYIKGNSAKFVAGSNDFEANEFLDSGLSYEDSRLTWTPPKVKREGWMNVYPTSTGSFMARTSDAYESENNANDFAQPGRLACVRIEWEEQP